MSPDWDPAESDFVAFVRRHTDRLDADRAAIERGACDVAAILAPTFARLNFGSDEAAALVSGYTSGLADYVRASNADLRECMEVIAEGAATHGLVVRDRYFAGGFPTDSFNARAIRERSTYLLLVHWGFSRFVGEASRIVFAIHNLLSVSPEARWPEPSWLRRATTNDLVDEFVHLVRSAERPLPSFIEAGANAQAAARGGASLMARPAQLPVPLSKQRRWTSAQSSSSSNLR